MQAKLVSTALGIFGAGALVGWAVTADIHEKRLVRSLEDALELIGNQEKTVNRLMEDNIALMSGYVLMPTQAQMDEVDGVDPNQGVLDEVESDEVQDQFKDVEISQETLDEIYPPSDNVVTHLEPFTPSDDLETQVDVVNIFDTAVVDEDDLIEVEVEVDDEEVPDEPVEVTRSKLQNLINSYAADPDKVAEHEAFVDRAVSENKKEAPFIISREDYAGDEEGMEYEKITLEYYPRDRILLDELEDPVDIAKIIGYRNIAQFGGISGDDDTVFVRNRYLETDFEVVKDDEKPLPTHIKYGMEKEEFQVRKAAGTIKIRPEDE